MFAWLGSAISLLASFLKPIAGAAGGRVAEEITGEAELRRRREADAREQAQVEMGQAQLEDEYARIRREEEAQ